MFSEVTIIMKDDEKTLRTKYSNYEPITVNENDPFIKECIEASLKNFDGEPEDIKVNISMIVK